MLYGYFLWSYKEVAPPADSDASWWSRFLRSPASNYAAAIILGEVESWKLVRETPLLILGKTAHVALVS